MTDPQADPLPEKHRAALAALLANLAEALAPDAKPAVADEAAKRRADLELALSQAAEVEADPDPPEERPRDLTADVVSAIDVTTAGELAQHPDRLLAALRTAEAEALKAGGLHAGPVALARALHAGHRGEAAPPDLATGAERELSRRDRAGHRAERLALLDASEAADRDDGGEAVRKRLRAARTALDAVRDMRPVVAAARDGADRRRPVALADVAGDLPAPVLSCADRDGRRDGALLSVGTVGILTGVPGAAKSTLVRHLAAEAASTPAGADRAVLGGALVVSGGPVLLALYEEPPTVARERTARLVEHLTAPTPHGPLPLNTAPEADATMRRVHVLNLAGRPLYGPAPAKEGAPAFYNARPGPLDGWPDLWAAVEATGARLVVVDPLLSAYVGEANNPAPVREFTGALALEAERRGATVLLIHHSTKAAGSSGDLYDPGNVSGTGQWEAACRGTLTLQHDHDAGPDTWRLAVGKANWGPQRMYATLRPIRHGRALVGFTSAPADGGEHWRHGRPPKPEAEAKRERNGRKTADVAAAEHEFEPIE